MLSQTLNQALNEQISYENYSAFIYKAMQAYFEAEDLSGMANWMNIQYQEELSHAEKMFQYVCDAGGRVEILGMDTPNNEYTSPLQVFESALEHEQKVTQRINDLMEQAQAEKNHAAQIFLQWFVTEQVEEEASADAIVQQLKLADGAPGALYMLDKELGQRTFAPPSAEA